MIVSPYERSAALTNSDTVLERLIAGLPARDTPSDGQVPPVAILWTDPKQEWLPLVDLLLERVEECLVLGKHQPERRTGPAVWVRCVVDRTIDEPGLPRDRPPVVYLPGVARQDLRAAEECPDPLKPLVELLFRGALWHHPTCHLSVCKLSIGRAVAPNRGQVATLLMSVAVRRVLNDLPDDLWTKVNIEFYSDPADGVFEALLD